ncbi:MAG: glycosyltransferase family 2 protein [Myxococcota bacterium]
MPELLSVVIPARNEEKNIGPCLDELSFELEREKIPFELIVVDDVSEDRTACFVEQRTDSRIRLIRRRGEPGFGRAVRAGLDAMAGEVVVIYMADRSDDPRDAVAYYRAIQSGYDCVFGSRFVPGGSVEHYPPVKRAVNRLVNRTVQVLFWTRFNDLTNAFKAYRADVIRDCGPYSASHFNITLEMSLSALIREYRTVQIPIRWYGRTWGSTHLRLRDMGRKYLYVLIKMWAERILIKDDIMADRRAHDRARR